MNIFVIGFILFTFLYLYHNGISPLNVLLYIVLW